MSFDIASFEKRTLQCRGKVFYQYSVSSTNDEVRKDILSGRASSGNIYLAEFQSHGRGRGENRWICPAGEGLLFSLVLDPDVAQALWYRMSLAVGVAIVESLGKSGLEAQLKWPNDIYVNDKKLGGVLIEQVNNLLVVGVGLNVNVEEFPEAMSERATSLLLELHEDVKREVLLSEIINGIYQRGSMIGDSFSHLIKLAMGFFYLKNERVSMNVSGDRVVGEVLGMSKDGYLSVVIDNKLVEVNLASEIEILR